MASAKIIIKAQDQTKQGVKDAQKSLQGLNSVVSTLGDNLSKALSFAGITIGIKALGTAIKGCFDEFNTANKTYTQLKMALGTGEEYKKVCKSIDELSRYTTESKSSIESLASELAVLGHSSDEIDKITSASVYLSNVTGKSLNESMNMLLATYQGSTSELEKLGLEVGNFTAKELASGKAIDVVNSSLGEYSKAVAEASTSQHLSNISDSWTDIKRSIGDIVDTSFEPLISGFDTALSELKTKLNGITENIKTVISNFPEFISKVGELLSSMAKSLFSYDGIKTWLNGIATIIPKYFQLVLDNCLSLLQLALNTIPTAVESLLSGIGNYAMYLITSLCDEVGFDITELINNIGTWLTDSKIGQVINSVVSTAVNGVRLVGAIIKNIPAMIELVCDNAGVIVENLFISLKNFFYQSLSDAVSWLAQTLDKINFPQLIENLKTSFTNLFGQIGGWFTAIGETAKDTFRYIGEVLEVTFSWDTIKTTITVLFKNIGAIASNVIKTIFVYIPQMIGNVFSGIVEWIKYIGIKLKNSILGAIQNVIKEAGSKIQGTWFGKLFGLGDKLATIDLGIDLDSESEALAKAKNSFGAIGDKFSEAVENAVDTANTIVANNKEVTDKYSGIEGINVANSSYTSVKAKQVDSGNLVELLYTLSDAILDNKVDNSEVWTEIGAKFDELLSPVIKEWEASTGKTIGDKLATWTAKSSDEYLDLAGKSFAEIGTVFSDWGAEFLSSNKEDLADLWDSIEESMGDIFGDDINAFSLWLETFLTEKGVKVEGSGEGTDGGSDSSSGSSVTYAGLNWGNLTDSLGSAWSEQFNKESIDTSFISNLSSSFGSLLDAMGPIVDICTSSNPLLALLMQLLSEMCEDLAPFIEEVLAPLNIVISLIAESLSGWIIPILKLFEPIITLVAKGLAYIAIVFDVVGDAIQYAVGTVLNWLASINILGWKPFEGWGVGKLESPSWDRSYNEIMGKFDDQVADSKVETQDTSTSTSVSTASYQGASTYYFNIYQQAPVVGSGGMQEFAKMIKSEFAELAYTGA